MDFPVEATVQLGLFGDQREPQAVLLSHGFVLTPLGGGQVRAHGSFWQLKAAKAQLELLLPGGPDGSGPRSPRSKSLVRERRGSPAASDRRAQRPGQEGFVVDSDVFRYADSVRKRDVDAVLTRHAVTLTVRDDGHGNSTVTVRGHRSDAAAAKLKRDLEQLEKDLVRQEVSLADLDQSGHAVLETARRSGNVCDSVVVREARDRLVLVGLPRDTAELQRRLTGAAAGRRGRGWDRGSRARSTSSPAVLHGAAGQSGTAGRSPPANRDQRDDGSQPERQARGRLRALSFRGRSRSELRPPKDKRNGASPERDDTRQSPKPKANKLLDAWNRLRKKKKPRK